MGPMSFQPLCVQRGGLKWLAVGFPYVFGCLTVSAAECAALGFYTYVRVWLRSETVDLLLTANFSGCKLTQASGKHKSSLEGMRCADWMLAWTTDRSLVNLISSLGFQAVTHAGTWDSLIPLVGGLSPAAELGGSLQSLYQTHLEAFDRHRLQGPDPSQLTRYAFLVAAV